MQYKILCDKSIKVILDKSDMNKYNLIYNKINENSNQTLLMFTDIIEKIINETNIILDEKTLDIEVYPDKNSGCIIYISYDDSESVTQTNIYYFTELKVLIEFAQNIFPIINIFNCESSLYFCKTGFYLVITFYNKYESLIKHYLLSSLTPVSSGEINHAFIKEHYECISENKTIERLSKISID